MKSLLILLLIFSFNSHSFLLKQGAVVVTMSDIDSLIMDIPEEMRDTVITSSRSLERNIYHVLNMNIINEYVHQNNLDEKESLFKDISPEYTLAEQSLSKFVNELGYEEQELIDSYKNYLYKKAIYSAFFDYAKEKIDKKYATDLANDYYLINKKSYFVPEKRSLHVIEISKESEYAQQANQLLSDLVTSDDKELFSQYALKYSNDPSVESNWGFLGEFKKEDLRYPFKNELFAGNQLGVSNKLYEDANNFYIVKLEAIVPERTIPFEELKEGLVAEVVEKQSNHFIEKIINQANAKLEINEDLAKQVFVRYNFLLEN